MAKIRIRSSNKASNDANISIKGKPKDTESNDANITIHVTKK